MFNNGSLEAFWTKISGLNGHSCTQPSNNIKDPLWRITHRLLGGNVLYRQDLGYYVKKSDLKIMLLMDEGEKVDWLWYITESLLDSKKTSSKNLAIGGGSFISYLAKQLGFTFGSRKGAKDELHKDRMISMSILGKGGLWKVKEEDTSLVEEKPILDEKPSLPIPPSFHTSPQVLNVLHEILAKLDALTQSHNNFVSLVTSHLGIDTSRVGNSSCVPIVPVNDGVAKSLEGESDTIDEGAELGEKSA